MAFVAQRRAYLSSSGCLCVVEGDELRVEVTVLVSGRDEVAVEVVVDWPERVVVVEAWMKPCGVAEFQRWRGASERVGTNTGECRE